MGGTNVRVLVTGATGYIGGHLVPRLLKAGHSVRCLARDAQRLTGRFSGAEVIEGDIFNERPLRRAFEGVDATYYLVHSMSDSHTFAERDREAAALFGKSAREVGVPRIIYLGGLGADGAALSRHLASRHEVGDVLRSYGGEVVEFRAAMIIGSGSISFEMLRYLTERLPLMIAPRWVTTRSQPISVVDVLRYLVSALDLPHAQSRIYEIGGADIVTYRDMMLRYARLRGLKRKVVTVPFFTPRLSSYWVHLVTPISSQLAQPLILGLGNEMIVRDDKARREFSEIVPIGFGAAVSRALDRYCASGSDTTWFDTFEVRTLPARFAGAREGMLIDRKERIADATPQRVASVFTQLGGKRGWPYGNALWRLRGRRSATDLGLGDAASCWHVDALETDHILRLRAEMNLPGKAWLQFDADRIGDGRTRLTQTAFFEPRGLFGFLYWYLVFPLHALIFSRMASRIVFLAERTPPASTSRLR
ncbi:MAG TPA: DUF2867 domain-containing protein [Candidatus Acidoferrales bacterium]|nr:DUF2867 domain-containing protein [Candidatus Acidoferrales bacterium]